MNHETATVILNIDNTERTQDCWVMAARVARLRAEPDEIRTAEQVAEQMLAEQLHAEHDAHRPARSNGADIYSSLLSIALGRVEWRAVARHVLSMQAEIDA
jgi:hypothetical protein